jgi:PAS domain S-box-containing protein
VDDELRDDQRLCDALWCRSPVPSAIVNPNGRFRDINAAWARFLGYSRSELIGQHFEKITHPSDIDSDKAEVAELHADKDRQGYSMVKKYLGKRNTVVWVELHVAAIRDDNGTIDYFVVVAIPCGEIADDSDAQKVGSGKRTFDRMGAFVSDNPRLTLGFFLLSLVAIGRIPFSAITDAITHLFKP